MATDVVKQIQKATRRKFCVFRASCPAVPFQVVHSFRGCCPPHRSEATLVVNIVI
jgi:hypothetical protein